MQAANQPAHPESPLKMISKAAGVKSRNGSQTKLQTLAVGRKTKIQPLGGKQLPQGSASSRTLGGKERSKDMALKQGGPDPLESRTATLL